MEREKPKFTKLGRSSNGIRKHKAFSCEMDESVTPGPKQTEHQKQLAPRQPRSESSKIRTSPAFLENPVDEPTVETDASFERSSFTPRITRQMATPLTPEKMRPFGK
jgi:hypothetical protein